MPTRVLLVSAAVAVVLLLAGCGEEAPPEIPRGRLVRGEERAARSLLALSPERCRAGEVFRRQPNGDGELVVLGTGLTRGDTVLWNGRPLKTTFGNSRLVTAAVPPGLIESPGPVEVTIEDAIDPSRAKLRASFQIAP
jgi:hypothetical protein